jgi:hypothetical protein
MIISEDTLFAEEANKIIGRIMIIKLDKFIFDAMDRSAYKLLNLFNICIKLPPPIIKKKITYLYIILYKKLSKKSLKTEKMRK